nr:undecaprenyl-diphosphate phosphatase [Candidatus Formimonas warabiya]
MDVVLHLGTLLAVLVYFWHDFLDIIIKGLSRPFTKEGKSLWFIAIATIPGALFGVLLDDLVEKVFWEQILLTALVLTGFGIVRYLTDKYSKKIVI